MLVSSLTAERATSRVRQQAAATAMLRVIGTLSAA
jgi:hypothetical protein